MYVDIFPGEAGHERPHVHVSKNPEHSGRDSLKFWLDPVELDDESQLQGFTPRELREVKRFVKRNIDIIRDRYKVLHARAMQEAAR